MNRHQHNPRLVGVIGHTGMPQPEITNDQRPLRQSRLYRRTDFTPRFEYIAPDSGLGSSRRVGGCIGMTAQPDLSGAVFRRRVDEIDVDAESEWNPGEIEVYIYMDGLAGVGFEGGVGAVEAHVRGGSEHTFGDGHGPRVRDDVVKHVTRFDHGFLLDVSCAWTEVAVRAGVVVQDLGLLDHAAVQLVEMGWVDGVGDGADSIPV